MLDKSIPSIAMASIGPVDDCCDFCDAPFGDPVKGCCDWCNVIDAKQTTDKAERQKSLRSVLPNASEYRQTVALRGSTEALPSAFTRSDGSTIIYAGRLNAMYGRPNVGKSFVALMVAQESQAQGGRVLWIDAEDTADTVARRANLLGYAGVADDAFWYTGVDMVSDSKAMHEINWWLRQPAFPGLVIIDACESAGCPSDGSDVRPWFAKFVDPFLKNGIGVLMLDHIPKNAEGRAAGQIGSQYKMASLTGAGIKLSGKPWNQVAGGYVTLTVEKDRQGQLPVVIGEKVATISGDYVNGAFQYTVGESVGGNQVSILGNKVLALLAAEPDGLLGNTAFTDLLKCKRVHLVAALKALVDMALVSKEREGKGYRYTITEQGVEHLDAEGQQGEMELVESA